MTTQMDVDGLPREMVDRITDSFDPVRIIIFG